LLLGELLALTLRFDVSPLRSHGEWWAELVRQCHNLVQWGLLAGLATLALAAPRLARFPTHFQADHDRKWLAYLAAHLTAFLAFGLATAWVLEGGAADGPWAGVVVLGWMAWAGVTVGLAVAAAVSPREWPAALRRHGGVLAAGVVVGTAVWGASRFTGYWWRWLGDGTLAVVSALLRLVDRDAVCVPTDALVGTRTFQVYVAPQCSGYEGIGLIWGFLVVYLWLFRRELRFPHALLLIPLGTLLIWLANALRIVALILVGTWVSPDVAREGFHSQAGWMTLIVVSFGLVALTRRTRLFAAANVSADDETFTNPTARYLAPLLAIVAAQMVGAALSAGFDRLYPLRVLAAGAALGFVAWRGVPWGWGWSWSAVGLGIAAFAVWMALDPLTVRDPAAEARWLTALDELPEDETYLWLAFRVVGAVVTVPLAEELAFRGYLLRRLTARDFEAVPLTRFTWLSFLGSSALFGLLHGRIVAGTLAGMIYALAAYRRGRLADAVIAHATTNLLIAVWVLATYDFHLWM
jgi:exosortase E/protease (VPEID-CTERM system)